jgi:transposase-like protein/IS1 family transposase
MQCPTCQQDGRKFGKDRYGNQRFQCEPCKKTFSDRPAKPLGDMRLSLDKAIFVLKLLKEGNSVRATVRITGVAKATVLALLIGVGQNCESFLAEKLVAIPTQDVQADEIWGFVGMKEKTARKKNIDGSEVGDAYCFCAIDRKTKLILSWHLGKRDAKNTVEFADDLEQSTTGKFQLTTDGFGPYPEAVAVAFEGRNIDHAKLVKTYGKFEDDHRYSPSEVLDVKAYQCCGNPDLDKACTSHIERQNLTIRMQNRRMTRLTNAFSKKWDNHRYAMALHFAVYNFVTPHGTLTKAAEGVKTTPAMEAGLTDHPWTLEELLIEASKSTLS